jgi:hypothetical protein
MKNRLNFSGDVFQSGPIKLTRSIQNQVKGSKNMIHKKQTLGSVLATLLLVLFTTLVLALSIRGYAGNPNIHELNTDFWKDNGPLELSPERGRFALLYSFLEEHSLQFSVPVARFATPDVVYVNNHYASMFAPGVSFMIMPGYILGKMIGYSQIGSFAMIALFALVNVLLVRSIAIRLGAHPIAAGIAAVAFLFATPAFSYAVTLYQHHISTFLILASFYLLIRYNTIFSLALIWFFCAASIVIDYPNVFMLFPIGLAALGKIVSVHKQMKSYVLSVKYLRVISFLLAIVPMAFFFWFNSMSYDNPMQLSGTLQRAQAIGVDGKPVQDESFLITQKILSETSQSEVITQGFFRTRLLINGFYTHFLSPDRGVIVYAPIVLFAIAGVIASYRRRVPYLSILLGIIGANIILYSMWDDPYGGWAFGSRYLIPTYALCGVLMGLVLTFWRKNLLFLFLFFVVFIYATSVNTLGAITTNRNPPKIEILSLEQQTHRHEPYTFERNINFLSQYGSKSFVYQTYASDYMTAWKYYQILSTFIIVVVAAMLIYYPIAERRAYESSIS